MQGTDLAVLESKVGYFRSANNKIRFTADPTVELPSYNETYYK